MSHTQVGLDLSGCGIYPPTLQNAEKNNYPDSEQDAEYDDSH